MASKKILVVEDDPQARDTLIPYLERDRYVVVWAETGEEGLKLASTQKPDLIVLDINLPGMDGFEFLRQLQAKPYIPIIVVTGRQEATDKVVGLELGADDYITKPFDAREMVARVKAVLRRVRLAAEGGEEEKKICAGGITLDTKSRKIVAGEASAPLTATEYLVLKLLMRRKGQVFTREQILDQVWGEEFAGQPRVVDTQVWSLRKKLHGLGATETIHAVVGVGYKFED